MWALASKGEISKMVQNKMTKYIPQTKKHPEILEWECAMRVKPQAMQQGRCGKGRATRGMRTGL
jgi:hypothetical protein